MVYSATHYSTYTTRSESHTEARKQAWPFWAVSGVIHRSCSASDVGQQFAFSSVCWAPYWGQWGGGDYIVLFGPPCCMRLTSRFLSLYPLLCPLTQHTQTHSHGLLPFNSQLGIRKLERWGELHKENTNVKKKTGTCIAISRHQNLSFK